MNLLLALILIIPKALSDGFEQRGWGSIGGFIKSLWWLFVVVMIFGYSFQVINYHSDISDFWHSFIGFVFLRYGIYDYIRNLAKGDPLFYLGKTKWYDRLYQWFFRITKWPQAHFLFFTKAILGIWGISWLLGWMDGIRF